jgi:hypothetical protein
MFKKALKKIKSDAQQPFGKGPYPQSVGGTQNHSVSQQPFGKWPYPQSAVPPARNGLKWSLKRAVPKVGVAQYYSAARGRDPSTALWKRAVPPNLNSVARACKAGGSFASCGRDRSTAL